MVIIVPSLILPKRIIPRGTKDHWVDPLKNLNITLSSLQKHNFHCHNSLNQWQLQPLLQFFQKYSTKGALRIIDLIYHKNFRINLSLLQHFNKYLGSCNWWKSDCFYSDTCTVVKIVLISMDKCFYLIFLI